MCYEFEETSKVKKLEIVDEILRGKGRKLEKEILSL